MQGNSLSARKQTYREYFLENEKQRIGTPAFNAELTVTCFDKLEKSMEAVEKTNGQEQASGNEIICPFVF